MSVHIFRKNRDRRFVDAVVASGAGFPVELSENAIDSRLYDEKFHIYPNTNRSLWPADRPQCRYFIACSCDFASAKRCEDNLEYILNTAEETNFGSIAIPAQLFSPALPFLQLRQIITRLKSEGLTVYIITDENFSPFTDRQLHREISTYIHTFSQPSSTENRPLFSRLTSRFGIDDTDDEDDYLNDVISILKRNSDKAESAEDTPSDTADEKQKPVWFESLEEYISTQDESFADMLFHLIDEKGLDEVECYKRANVNRRTFSKIRTDISYHPSKKTVLAFCISLQLNINETSALLKSAGYALTNSSKRDLIVEYFILNQRYDIFEINDALYAFDQPLLGV